MSEFYTNFSKMAIAVGGLIVLTGWTFGYLKTADLNAVLGVLLTAHAAVSGIAGFVGGPTRNSEVTK